MTVPQPSPEPTESPPVPGWLLATGLSFLLAVLIVLPFFKWGTASGHDFEFHAASWLDAAYQWKEGTFYPRWTAWTNHGFGEPRFIFYPPLSWMLGALLTLLFPGPLAPVVFIVLTQTLAGLSAYFLVRRVVSPRAAVLGAGLYAINPDALLITYIRSDFAEQLACAIFPLLFLAVLRLCEVLDEPPPQQSSSVALMAVPFAGVWLCNAPAGVIVSYSIVLLIAWAAVTQRSWSILLRGIAALTLGFGLTGAYILPAAYEQRWVNIGQAVSGGLLPTENFLFTRIADAEHTWFNWISSVCALACILLFAVAALASRRFVIAPECAPISGRKVSAPLLALGAVATMLTLRFTLPLWNYLPKLRFVQFPWRWISVIALVGTCFTSFLFQKRRAWILFLLLVVLSVPLAQFLMTNTWWDADEMPTQRDAIDSGKGFDGVDEYDPLGDDHNDLPAAAPRAKALPAESGASGTKPAKIEIRRWATESKIIEVDATSEAEIALRLLNYPAWRVEVNGKPVQPGRSDDFNAMVMPIPAGHSEIQVQFTRTPDRKLGNMLTGASLFITIFLLWFGRQRGKP